MLPASVMQEASAAVLDLNGSGLSVLEISHRGAAFTAILEETRQLVRTLLKLPETHEPLFLTGGASSQFFMTAMNLLAPGEKAAFIDTGAWSAKAIKEARRFGAIEVVGSSASDRYRHIPKSYAVPDEAVYLHFTSNNTIYGTQFHQWPSVEQPLVCDMSSDIFSRRFQPERFGLIYAGAQKNLGPAGVTLVIVKRSWLDRLSPDLPTMLDYRTHVTKGSVFNTPPVFPIYVCLLTLRWLQGEGGIEEMEKRNQAKAESLYAEIDRNPLFSGQVAREDRSLMNATFAISDPKLETPFLDHCTKAGIVGIKGHRSVGGFRASIYNAMPRAGVERLVEEMQVFSHKYGFA